MPPIGYFIGSIWMTGSGNLGMVLPGMAGMVRAEAEPAAAQRITARPRDKIVFRIATLT
jgi:hypothetical protein